MILEVVSIQNFLGWKQLTFALHNRGLTYLVGPNGSGKSSIPAAIVWAATGRCERADLADHVVRNWWLPNPDPCLVCLSFRSGKHRVEVVRKRHKGSGDINIEVDGYSITARHNRETNDRIVQHLGDFDYLLSSMIFGSGGSGFFSELIESEQKRVLRDMYHFDVFVKAGEYVKERTSEHETKLTSFAFDLERSKGVLKGFTDNLNRLSTAIEKAERKARIETAKVAEQMSLVQRKIEQLEGEAQEAQAELRILLNRLNQAQSLTSELDLLNSQLSTLREIKVCPQCGRPLRAPDRKKQIISLKERKQQIVDELRDLEPLGKERIRELEEHRVKCEASLKGYDKEISALSAQIQVGNVSVDTLRQQYAIAMKKVTRAERDVRTQKRSVASVEEQLRYWDWWRSAYGSRGLETLALQRALPDFNNRVNRYLQRLPTERGVVESEYHVTEEGRLKHRLHYPGGQSYAGASGGERRRVDFAVAMARQELLPHQLNVLFLDEPFEHVDDAGSAIQQLNTLKKESIFVMSHRSDLDKWFPSVVYFRCKNGACEIESESRRAVDVMTLEEC